MNTINLPGFTAEVSLYKIRTQYHTNASKLVRTEAHIFPQLKITATGGIGASKELGQICAEIGSIVDEFYQDSIDPNSPTAQDSKNTALAMYNRSKRLCSFKVTP